MSDQRPWRVGSHWGTTIVAEGAGQQIDPAGRRVGDELIAMASSPEWAQRIVECRAEMLRLRARLHAAHDALTRILDGDVEDFVTLESTVEYVVKTYRWIAESEDRAAEHVHQLSAFARWLIALDDPDGPGAEARRTVTLTEIIRRAQEALGDDVAGDPRESAPVAPTGCDDCSVEPGEPHRYPGCPGAERQREREAGHV